VLRLALLNGSPDEPFKNTKVALVSKKGDAEASP